ncbi:uncharacterized protein LOC144916281 isoform X1 [Branchiostoma floridae x Branchiostoma belcheri]
MSRHRNIRSMNVHDEYEGYDDVYGHSVEDDYGVSPATEAQFMYRRSEAPRLSSFIEESKKESIEEEDEYDYDDHEDHDHSLSDSQTFQWPRLSDQNEARLRSCLEEIHNVIGDSVPQHILVDTVMKCDFDLEKALDAVLSLQDKPKEARPPPTAAAPPRTQEHTSVDLASPVGLLELTTEVPTSDSQCSTAMPPTDIPPLLQSSLSSLSPPRSIISTKGNNLLKDKKMDNSPLMSLSQLAGVHLGSVDTAKTISPTQPAIGHSFGKLNPNISSKPVPHMVGSKDISVGSVRSPQRTNNSTMSLSELANLHLGSEDEKMSTSPLGPIGGNLGGKIAHPQSVSIGSSNLPTLGALGSLSQVHQAPRKATTNTQTVNSPSTLSPLAVSGKDLNSDDKGLKIAAHGTASSLSTIDRSQHRIAVGKTKKVAEVETSGGLSTSPGLLSTPLSQLSSSPLGLGLGLLSGKNTSGSQSSSLPTGTSPPGLFPDISQSGSNPQKTLASLSSVSQTSSSKTTSLYGLDQSSVSLDKLGGGLSSTGQTGLQLTMMGSSSSGKLGAVSLSDYQFLGQGFGGDSLEGLGPLGSQRQASKTNFADGGNPTLPGSSLFGAISNNVGIGSSDGTKKGSSALQLPLSSLCSTAGDVTVTSGLSGTTGGTHIDLSAALRKDEPMPLHLSIKTQAKAESSKILPVKRQMSEIDEAEYRPISPFYWEQNVSKEAMSQPSPFAQALCCKDCHYKQAGNHPRFSYYHQRKGQRSVSPVQVAQIVPFDFSTPSPDDVVKKKQKGAFTRPNDVG